MTNCGADSVQRRLHGIALAWLAVLASASPLVAAATRATSGAASGPTSEAASAPNQGATSRSKAASAASAKLVDINSASRKELKTLPGIGDAEADKIIANRPYLSKTDLVGKNVLPIGPYLSLRNQIIAKQKGTKEVKQSNVPRKVAAP